MNFACAGAVELAEKRGNSATWTAKRCHFSASSSHGLLSSFGPCGHGVALRRQCAVLIGSVLEH